MWICSVASVSGLICLDVNRVFVDFFFEEFADFFMSK